LQKHVPKSVETSHEGKLNKLWNELQTDRTIPNDKPENTIRDNEKGMPINAAISGDRNVIKKQAKKILKYKNLAVNVECDNNNNRSSWKHLKIIQKNPINIPGRYIFKYKQAVFAHYLSDVIPLFLFYI
jgi:hypothetical protein